MSPRPQSAKPKPSGEQLAAAMRALDAKRYTPLLWQLIDSIDRALGSTELAAVFHAIWAKQLMRPLQATLVLRQLPPAEVISATTPPTSVAGRLFDHVRTAYGFAHWLQRPARDIDVLLTCYSHSHIPTLAAVARQARCEGRSVAYLFFLGGMIGRANLHIEPLLLRCRREGVGVMFYEVERTHRKSPDIAAFCQACASLSADRLELDEPLREALDRSQIEALCRIVAAYMVDTRDANEMWDATAAAILERTRPSQVVGPSRLGLFPYILRRQCRRLGIPMTAVQHGNLGGAFHHRIPGDRLAVWGSGTRELLIKTGLEPERLVTTGPPHLDLAPPRQRPADGRFRMVYMTQPLEPTMGTFRPEEKRDILALLDRALETLPTLEIVIKAHPADDARIEREHQFVDAARVSFTDEREALQCIADAEAVFTMSSSTGLEAIALGKPLIYYAKNHIAKTLGWHRSNVALPVCNEDEMAGAIVRAAHELSGRLHEMRDEAWIAEHFHKIDGRAAERVLAIGDRIGG